MNEARAFKSYQIMPRLLSGYEKGIGYVNCFFVLLSMPFEAGSTKTSFLQVRNLSS